jgi:hypothetical protein
LLALLSRPNVVSFAGGIAGSSLFPDEALYETFARLMWTRREVFDSFDWVLQAGIIATVAGLNAITIAMLLANDFSGPSRVALSRLLAIAAITVTANLPFLFLPSDIMDTTDTVIVAITVPNLLYSSSTVLGEWYTASAKPAIDTLLDGRAALWIGSILTTLWCCARLQRGRWHRISERGSSQHA